MEHEYPRLHDLVDATDVEDLFDAIDARDQHISNLEEFIEGDDAIKSAWDAWKTENLN